MTFLSTPELAGPRTDGCRIPSTTRRQFSRRAVEILPGLVLNSIVAGAAFGVRLLPGMSTFSPMILSIMIGIAFHNIVGTAAWAKAGVTFSLRWVLRGAIILLGLQLTASQVVGIGGRGLGIIVVTWLATFAFTVWLGQLLCVEAKFRRR